MQSPLLIFVGLLIPLMTLHGSNSDPNNLVSDSDYGPKIRLRLRLLRLIAWHADGNVKWTDEFI